MDGMVKDLKGELDLDEEEREKKMLFYKGEIAWNGLGTTDKSPVRPVTPTWPTDKSAVVGLAGGLVNVEQLWRSGADRSQLKQST